MVTLHEVITFLVSMQISISSLQTHNVNRCGRSRHLARKLSLRRKRSSPNVFEMAATETITSIILIKLIRVSLGTVCFFFQAEDGIRDLTVTGVQTCALPIFARWGDQQDQDATDCAIAEVCCCYFVANSYWPVLLSLSAFAFNGNVCGKCVPQIGRASCRERV